MINLSGSAHNNLVSKEPKYWYAVYTKSRCEKAAHSKFKEKGINSYLPLLRKTRIYTRKKRIVELPLLSSYVFVKISRSEVIQVLQNPHVINFIKCAGELSRIHENEIKTLRKITGEYNDIDVTLKDIEQGDLVEIIAGSLVGLKGQLIEKTDKKNFFIRLNSIGVNLELYINKRYLRRVI